MLRWTHLAAAALLIVTLTLSPGAAPAPDLTDLARYAYIFTFPLYEMYRIRYLALCSPLNPPRYYQHGNFFDHPRRSWSWADVRRTAPQFCGLKFMDTGAMAVPIADVRFGHSTTRPRTAGGRRLARTPPRRVTRWLAASTVAPPAPALSSAGDDSRPRHAILDRKVAARLFRRCPRPVEAMIIPDSYASSMGSAFTEPG